MKFTTIRFIMAALFLVLIHSCAFKDPESSRPGNVALQLVFPDSTEAVSLEKAMSMTIDQVSIIIYNDAEEPVVNQNLTLSGSSFSGSFSVPAGSGYSVRMDCYQSSVCIYQGFRSNITVTGGQTTIVTVNLTLLISGLTLSPTTVTLDLGDTQQFSASATFPSAPVNVTSSATWSTSPGTAGSINSSGLFTASNSNWGTETVSVTFEGATRTATVYVQSATPYEPNDSLEIAYGPLQIDTEYSAFIEDTLDFDWYYFTLGTSMQKSITPISSQNVPERIFKTFNKIQKQSNDPVSSSPSNQIVTGGNQLLTSSIIKVSLAVPESQDYDLWLLDHSSNEIDGSVYNDPNEEISEILDDGTYYIVVRGWGSSYSTSDAYTLKYEELTGIANLTCYTGSHNTLYPTEVGFGGTFYQNFRVKNEGDVSSGSFDIDLYVSTNTTISTSDTKVGTIEVSAVSPGTYRDVVITGTLPGSVGDGNYWVGQIIDANNDVTEFDEDDNNWYFDALPLTVGHSLTMNGSVYTASLTADDHDWYYFTTSSAGNYTIETFGSTDTYLYLYDSDKTTILDEDDDGGTSTCSKITYSLSSNTTYIVDVKGFSSTTTGNYSVGVTN